jgi:hypothetical protein
VLLGEGEREGAFVLEGRGVRVFVELGVFVLEGVRATVFEGVRVLERVTELLGVGLDVKEGEEEELTEEVNELLSVG